MLYGADCLAGRLGFCERLAGALGDLVSSLASGQTAVVFTSGGVIAACCVRALGVPDDAFVALNRVMVKGGVTTFASGRHGTTLVSFNEHAHLGPGGLVTYR